MESDVYSHKYKKILFGIGGIGLLVVTFLFVQPAGYHYEDSCVSAATEDEMYYHVLKEKNTGKDNHVSMADFKIKKYAGNLKVKRQLQAEIQIEPDEKKHDKYEFTLYHGFKVKQIADGNRILRFEQKGDHRSEEGAYVNHHVVDAEPNGGCFIRCGLGNRGRDDRFEQGGTQSQVKVHEEYSRERGEHG